MADEVVDEVRVVTANGVEPAVKVLEVEITFRENDDDTVTASFPSINGGKAFQVTLQDMTWGLMEDLEAFFAKDKKQKDLAGFFNKYIVGGARAVPIKHTMTVFEAIQAYISEVTQVKAKN